MKPLEDHVLLYDGDCPMCRIYSHAFVKTKMLGEKGIMSYKSMSDEVRAAIDVDRARNEIALVNVKDQKVIYGVDSWFSIVTNSFPFLKWAEKFPPLYWLMKGLYFLISYNRRVIAPGKVVHREGACDPDYNITWRWIYIAVTSCFVGFILNRYFNGITIYRNAHFSFFTEWLIAVGQIAFQGAIVSFIRRGRLIHYFGQLMTVSMIGALLLGPVILIRRIFPEFREIIYLGYFTIPVSIMLWQHVRRVKMLELPFFLTITWILYRVFLFVAFFLLQNQHVIH